MPILELKQGWKESSAKSLTGFAGKHRWKVVDADNRQGCLILVAFDVDTHGGRVECGVDVVDGYRVVRVRGVT